MKKFIAGLIIGLMLTSTVSFAANQDISAVLTNFNFVVNGQAKTISTQPIAYNGTSYLPVRELSNLLGYEVTYNESSRTISLTNPSESNALNDQSPADLSDFILARDLYDLYGVTITMPDPKIPKMRLTYQGHDFETSDYVTIDGFLYFPKSILNQLKIDQ